MDNKDVQNNIVIYRNEQNQIECRVNLTNNTLWLSLEQIATVFGKNKSTISRHIKNIFETGELEKKTVVAFFCNNCK